VRKGTGSDPISRELIEYQGGLLRHDIEVVDDADNRQFRLVALDPSGAVLPNVTFSAGVTLSSGGGFSHWTGPATVRGGAYTVEFPDSIGLPEEAGPDDDVWIDAAHADYGSVRVVFDDGEREGTAQFEEPAFVVVTVANIGNLQADADLCVQVLPNGGSKRGPIAIEDVGVAGYVRVGGVVPGPYRIVLRRCTRQGRWFDFESIERDLHPGENHFTFELTAEHSLIVQLPEGSSHRRLSLYYADGPRDGERADSEWADNDVVTFHDLQAGLFEIRDRSDPPQLMTVNVPSGPVDFSGETATALAIAISDPDLRLGQIGLRSGDRVVAVGAQRYGEPGSDALITGAINALTGTQVITILRDGVEQEITFDTASLTTTQLGGTLLATSH